MGLIVKFAEPQNKNYSKNNYSNHDAIKKTVNYIFEGAKKLPKKERIYGVIGSAYTDASMVEKDFKKIKALYFSEGSLVKHIVVSMDDSSQCSRKLLEKYIAKLCDFFSEKHQVAYALHKYDSGNYHVHLIINTTGINGKRLHISGKDWALFKKQAEKYWKKYSRYYTYEEYS
ncbi:relaxase/mobilization nuclease domain-containing protein [Butyrivibrio sp. FCS006]|uniref:relaxase/mobilization nuclease domain-containing protein n=1 Tax=Butyrivibrio sp. FCS006 TaxID=1280684 RepID=UPI000419397A|nr:relaxase/mobilization nuclease domain-containing protein [Butyrivibrio sp. FCS006]